MKKCEKCGKEFENGRAYGGHITQCGISKKCEICGREFSIPHYIQHIKTHDKKIYCLHCGKLIVGEYIDKKRKYCSQSCCASHTNIGIRRRGEEPKKCLMCGKKLNRSNKKYCSYECNSKYVWIKAKEKIELTGVFGDCDYTARRFAKRYLIERDGHKCSRCGNAEWMGELIPLISDHIDGDHNNNKVENLRLVCGNCDMQLPTFAGKNKGNGREWRRNYYRTGNSSRLKVV